MIDNKTLEFLSELSSNNSKEWLDENRADYDFAKNNILSIAQTLINSASEFDVEIAKTD
ncbi:MAG: hypothetical protein ACJA2S_005663 [Cyclobacteriaceae bacterium]|jgi:uncharacterized protein (DUF2461 family)